MDFKKDQIYFKEIALNFLNKNGFEPFLAKSEKEAKEFNHDKFPNTYPIYFFKTDTSGEKSYEEFYTKDEDYDTNKFNSIGFIKYDKVNISTEDVLNDFENIFKNSKSEKLDIINVINKYVSNFKHIETGKNLDQKM